MGWASTCGVLTTEIASIVAALNYSIKPVANLSLGEHSHAVLGGESTRNSFDDEDIASTTCTSDDSSD